MGGIRRYCENYLQNGRLNRSKREAAKEAVLWFLRRRSACTVDEIAEHFGLELRLVYEIVGDLIRSKRVVWKDDKGMIELSDPLQKWWEKGGKV